MFIQNYPKAENNFYRSCILRGFICENLLQIYGGELETSVSNDFREKASFIFISLLTDLALCTLTWRTVLQCKCLFFESVDVGLISCKITVSL